MKIYNVIAIIICALVSNKSFSAYAEYEHLMVSTPIGVVDWGVEVVKPVGGNGIKWSSSLLSYPKQVRLQLTYADGYGPEGKPGYVDCKSETPVYDRSTGQHTLERDEYCNRNQRSYVITEVNSFNRIDLYKKSYKTAPESDLIYSHENRYLFGGLMLCGSYKDKNDQALPSSGCVLRENKEGVTVDSGKYIIKDAQATKLEIGPDTVYSFWVYNTETGLSFKYEAKLEGIASEIVDGNFLRPIAVRKKNGEELYFEWPEKPVYEHSDIAVNLLPEIPVRLFNSTGKDILKWELEYKKWEKLDSVKNVTKVIREEYQVKSLSDHYGRTITYTYENDVIISHTGIDGYVWNYEYDHLQEPNNERYLIKSIIDPEGYKTQFFNPFVKDGIGFGYRTPAGEGYIIYERTEDIDLATAKRTVTKEFNNGRIEERVYELIYEETTPSNGSGSEVASRAMLKKQYIKEIKVNGEVILDISEGRELEDPYIIYTRSITSGQYGYEILSKYNTVFEFDQASQISVTFPTGDEYKYEYDQFSNLSSISRIIEKTDTSTTYDNEGIWRYDGYNQLVFEQDAQGNKIEFEYDESGNNILERHFNLDGTDSIEYKYEYDDHHRLIKTIDPEGGVVEYKDFHYHGQPKKIIDELGRVSVYEYDVTGNLISWEDPIKRKQLLFYDKRGEFYKKQLPDGNIVEYTLDGDGYALKEKDEKGHVSETQYDNAHQITRYLQPADSTSVAPRAWEYAYDAHGNILKHQEPGGHISEWQYKASELKSVKFPTAQLKLSYDKAGQVKSTQWQADNGKTKNRSYAYDVLNNPTTATDALANESTTKYDRIGQLVEQTDALNNTTYYEYDAYGNLTNVIDAEGRRLQFEYNKNGWLTKEIRHNGQTREITYYANGNIKQITDAQGQIAKFTFNDGDQLTKVEHFQSSAEPDPAKTIHYEYNLRGQQTKYDDGQTSATYEYSERNELTSVTQQYPAFSKTISYDYYPNGNLKSYTNAEGVTYSYTYNKDNNVQTVMIPNIGQMIYSNYAWHVPNKLMYPGGATLDLSHDGYENLLGYRLADPQGNEITSTNYALDAEDNITQIQSENNSSELSYTDRYELYKEIIRQSDTVIADTTYEYDGVSNRIGQDEQVANSNIIRSYNENHQLIDDNGLTHTYDDNGALIRKNLNPEGTAYWAFTYDIAERLTAIIDQDNTVVASYTYDPNGYRLSKTVNGVATYYLYNQMGLAAEYNAGGQLIAEYQFAPADYYSTSPLFTRQNGQVYFYQNESRLAPERLIDTAGNVVWHGQYDGFGNVTILINTVKNSLRLPGQYFDDETGYHYNLMRYYDPKLGRYLREDPLGFAGSGTNYYSYAGQNPYSYIDPRGEVAQAAIGVVICVLMNGGCWDWTCALTGGIGGVIGKFGGKFGGGIGKGPKGPKPPKNDKDKDKDKDKDPCGCFTGDTQVVVEDEKSENTDALTAATQNPQHEAEALLAAPTKPIRDIRVGDSVLSKNVVTGEVGYKPVAQLFTYSDRGIYELTLADETGQLTHIEVTDDHPFWVNDFGWMNSINLVPGLNVDTRSEQTLTVIDLKFLNRFEQVYNFEVSDWHSYFVSDAGVLVHNTQDPCDIDKKKKKERCANIFSAIALAACLSDAAYDSTNSDLGSDNPYSPSETDFNYQPDKIKPEDRRKKGKKKKHGRRSGRR